MNDSRLQDLTWRCIGPPRGGRVVAVAGHPTDTMVFYFGAVAGGIWKTDDGGTYWHNVSDGYLNSSSIGALAVADADANVVYAGTGESTIRTDVSYGDGVYRSTDAGRTWRHLGLADTHHIGEIRVHPQDPDLVYVAAFGHAFGPNAERGIYRSRDGGSNWEQVLARGPRAGAVDLAMDQSNPRILYAALWQAQRSFWELSSGGPDSGLYRSVDGGDTWQDLSEAAGFPAGIKGKIGVAVSPQRSGRVWALVEAEAAGLYRSDDGGDTWTLANGNRDLRHRPWYYNHVFADPQVADTVYVTNLKLWKSTDAGAGFSEITTPHGDNHDLWIDPANPQRMIEGNDGGACVSFNGGNSWSTIYNQLTAQLYRLDIDNQFPYRVYATQQDNSSMSVPSATESGAITWGDCYPAGTGESGFMAVHPEDPNIVYIGAVGSSPGGSGVLQRYDHRSRQIRLVNVWPEAFLGHPPSELKYRFAWTYPIAFSPHDAGVLYAGGNHLFRSRDEGHSWEVLSPDLTRADPTKLRASGGPLTTDASGAEHYCTLSSFAESPHQAGVLWAASDDGLVHLSRDDGASWDDVTPPELPEWSYIGTLEVDPHAPAAAYVAATRYKLDDYRPFLFKTEDYGASWRNITGDFPGDAITRVIRADPVSRGLLFVGTETGTMLSVDDGQHWQSLRNNLPVAPVYDLAVKGDDLVVATHGRSFWVLDDITPLREFVTAADSNGAPHLFPPRTTVRLRQSWSGDPGSGAGKNYMLGLGANAAFYEEAAGPGGERRRTFLDAGANPPQGVIVYYLLADEGQATLSFCDADGQEIATFSSSVSQDDDQALPPLPTQPGLNRFVWNMRYPDATKIDSDLAMHAYTPLTPSRHSPHGPLAPPGTYQVRFEVGNFSATRSFEIRKDPRVAASAADFQRQFEMWSDARDLLAHLNEALNRARTVRRQVAEWQRRFGAAERAGDLGTAARQLLERLAAIEAELTQHEVESFIDGLRAPLQLDDQLGNIMSVIGVADVTPSRPAGEVLGWIRTQLHVPLSSLRSLEEKEIATFNQMVVTAGLAAVAPVSVAAEPG
jgi:photosystem II stability/assembly factor-like uncharacterized protein